MVRGLYTAASGALVAQSQADTIANNLANASTDGFKQTLLQISAAPTLDVYRFQTDPGQTDGKSAPGVSVAPYVGTLGTGAQVFDTPLEFSQGALQQTGNPLDVAIGGSNGFFAVQTQQGVRYTRDGQFVVSQNGQLTTQSGDPVLGSNGSPISVPQNTQNAQPVNIASDGAITQNGLSLGQLRIVQFSNLTALRPQGDNYLMDAGNANPTPAANASVQQGYLEKSGADVVRSMVDLIAAERWFEANTKMITTQDAATNLAITTVARSSAQ